MNEGVDILMITFNRPDYVVRSLPSLLDQCDDDARVWIWHNGDHERTLDTVRSHLDHPRVFRFHHSPDNVGLRTPTNWFWTESAGSYVSKVDDDCLLDDGWYQRLRAAHERNPDLGAIAASRIRQGEYRADLADRKIVDLEGGHRLLRNLWVQGSGYLMPRACIRDVGVLRADQTFTQYCIALEKAGYRNGWYFPLIAEEHMDDPRSPYTLLRTDEDLHRYGPLSARRNGSGTLCEWEAQLRRSATTLQEAPLDLGKYVGWRRVTAAAARRVRRIRTGRSW